MNYSLIRAARNNIETAAELLRMVGNPVIIFGGIGRERRITVYDIEADIVHCGCQDLTLAKFEDRVHNEHKNNNPHHYAEYMAAIEFIKACRKARLMYPKQDEPKLYAEQPAPPTYQGETVSSRDPRELQQGAINYATEAPSRMP